eukprot:553258-Pleurochrysis_carterae.AAC.2
MSITSTGVGRLFGLERAQDVSPQCWGKPRRPGVILGHADDTAARMRERANGEENWKLMRNRMRQHLNVTMLGERRATALLNNKHKLSLHKYGGTRNSGTRIYFQLIKQEKPVLLSIL